jgi:hypothetical protein
MIPHLFNITSITSDYSGFHLVELQKSNLTQRHREKKNILSASVSLCDSITLSVAYTIENRYKSLDAIALISF